MGLFSSKTAPPPDPRLTQAQIDSLAAQTDIATRTLQLQEEFHPLQKEAMQFGLDTSRTAYTQSQQDRSYALGKRDQLDAAMKPMLDEALNFNEADRRTQLMGESNAEITRNFGDAAGQQQRGLSRMGMSTTVDQRAAMKSSTDFAEARARSFAGEAVSTAAKQEGINARANAVNMLSGSGAMASGLTGAGAAIGGQAVNIVNSGSQGMNAGLSTANQIFGQMGRQASSLWNDQAQANYAAAKAKSDAKSQVFSTVIGAVAMVAMMSDRRLKRNVQRIGTTVKGVPIYRFQYIGSEGVYTGPMADEVEQIVPQAVRMIAGYKAVDYSMI